MGSCHIAHDCKVGNNNIFANGTLLGGHVVVGVSFSLIFCSSMYSGLVVEVESDSKLIQVLQCRTMLTLQGLLLFISSAILAPFLSLVVVLWYAHVLLLLLHVIVADVHLGMAFWK